MSRTFRSTEITRIPVHVAATPESSREIRPFDHYIKVEVYHRPEDKRFYASIALQCDELKVCDGVTYKYNITPLAQANLRVDLGHCPRYSFKALHEAVDRIPPGKIDEWVTWVIDSHASRLGWAITKVAPAGAGANL